MARVAVQYKTKGKKEGTRTNRNKRISYTLESSNETYYKTIVRRTKVFARGLLPVKWIGYTNRTVSRRLYSGYYTARYEGRRNVEMIAACSLNFSAK